MAKQNGNQATESETSNGAVTFTPEQRKEAQAKLKENIGAWAKGQRKVEDAKAALATAQAEQSGFAEQVYCAIGTDVFSVKGLDRDYRAMYISDRVTKGKGGAPDTVVPAHYQIKAVPDNKPKRTF